MHSNKFICEKVVKRGREWEGALRSSAQQEVKISLDGKREVTRWPAPRRWGAVKAPPYTCAEFITWNWSNWEGAGGRVVVGWGGGGGGVEATCKERDEEETRGLPVITAPLFKCQRLSACRSAKG